MAQSERWSVFQALVGVPGLVGVDMTKSVQVHVYLPDVKPDVPEFTPDKLAPLVAAVLPLSGDGKAFVSALKSAYPESNKSGNVHHFSRPAGNAAVPSKKLYLASHGSKVVIAKQPGAAEMALKGLKAQENNSPVSRFPGTARLYVNVDSAMTFVETVSEIARKEMAKQEMPEEMPMDVKAILDAEVKALIDLMGQLHSYTLGIKISPSSIDFYDRITPKQGTKTAEWIGGLKAPSPAYMSLLPENALLSSVGSGLSIMDQIAEPYGDLLTKIYEAMGPEFSQIAQPMSKWINEFAGMYAGDIAIGVIPVDGGAGVGFVEVIAVTDPAKAKSVIDEMYLSFNESFKGIIPGISMQIGEARKHKGVDVTAYSYKIDPQAGQPNATNQTGNAMPTPLPLPMPKWLNDIKWEMAFSGNNLIYTLGNEEVMNKILDTIDSPGKSVAESASFVKLFPNAKGNIVEIHTLSISGIIRQLLASVPNMDPQALAQIPADSEGIAGYSQAIKGNLVGLDKISMSEIKAIMGTVPAVQKAMPSIMSSLGVPMPGQAGGMPGSGMGGAPAMPMEQEAVPEALDPMQ